MEENANAREEGSGTRATSSVTIKEIINQYMSDMMDMSLATIGARVMVQQQRVDFAKICGDFINLGGKTFSGSEFVIEVQDWLDTCDIIFGDLELEDAMKRRVAPRQLVGIAMGWWNAVIVTTPENTITYGKFKTIFEEKFIPTAKRTELFNKFTFPKQGQRTITEYVMEFEALSKYGLLFVDTPRKSNEKFISGLKEDIGKQLIYHLNARFEEIVNMAIMQEIIYPEKCR